MFGNGVKMWIIVSYLLIEIIKDTIYSNNFIKLIRMENIMNFIRVSSLGGLFHEFYKPMPEGLATMQLDYNENELDATNLFWTLIFDITNIKQIIDKIEPTSPKKIAIMANVELFIKQIKMAKHNICNQNITPMEFFSYLETLSIVCNLYSEYVFYPHQFTIQNGFEIDCSSASKVFKNCLEEQENPFLKFIEFYIMPYIRTLLPRIIFIDGEPSFYNMAICRLVKKEFPYIHICLSRHSSEYYSLNKLEKNLVKNEYLFKMIDSVILEYFDETEDELINTITNNGDLSHIPNLVYKYKDKIYLTPYKVIKNDFIPDIQETYPTSELINVHLQPYIMCYWNKCTFCGINKKYHFYNTEMTYNELDMSLNVLKERIHTKVKYIWFIDEAIHPVKLKYIANYFIKNKLNIFWQARCRIEKILLNDELIQLLQKSGLRELRLGLESASINVLKSMNKFEEDFTLDLVDKICEKYSAAGISIHFPMIIGFPGESSSDRKKTYDYLGNLCQKYPLVSFNINVFNLDISSYIYKHPEKYGIEEIYYPCSLHDFLGNILQWRRGKSIQEEQLFKERDQYMREILYPWMPINSFVKPYLFYRLCETIRNTLIWKAQKNYAILDSEKSLDLQTKMIVPDTLVYKYDSTRNVYIIYNWYTHHYMIGNEHLIFIFKLFAEEYSLPEATKRLVTYNSSVYNYHDVELLLSKLYQQGYLIEINGKE